jgi:hypothetical protein
MADLLEHDQAIDEQEGHRREMDSGVRVLLAEVTAIIADRLGREGAPEREMMWALDGVPMAIVFEAADRLDVVVRFGVWRRRRA